MLLSSTSMLHRRSVRLADMPEQAPNLASQHRCQCWFMGRVQGVGFRYTVKNIVLRHNVNGYVRNLPDGRVELVMEGADEEMEQVIAAVNSRMNGYINKIVRQTEPATGEFDQFLIRH